MRIPTRMAATVCLVACGSPVSPGAQSVFTDVETGGYHTCAVDEQDRTFCWGYNPGAWLSEAGIAAAAGGASGTDSTDVEEWVAPRPIEADPRFVVIRAGGDFTCGLTATGPAHCWGRNERGQLGNGDSGGAGEVSFRPEPIRTDFRFARFAALTAPAHGCALDDAGAAYCWGNNYRRQLGAGWATDSLFHSVPASVTGGLRFRMVSAAGPETCALSFAQELYCWGADASGLNGFHRDYDRAEPVLIPTELPFDTIGVGSSVTCGLVDGRAYCRGWNGHGVLGTGDTVSRAEFAPVVGDLPFSSLSVGRVHVCGLTADGFAYCWGVGTFGRLGNGGEEDRLSPTAVAGGLEFREISAGGDHTCGLTVDGEIYCWGYGFYGQLGNGERDNSAAPLPISRPKPW